MGIMAVDQTRANPSRWLIGGPRLLDRLSPGNVYGWDCGHGWRHLISLAELASRWSSRVKSRYLVSLVFLNIALSLSFI